MTQLLDILGATVIGGFLLMMITYSNFRISDHSEEIFLTTITISDAVVSLEIIDFDFYKIGYGIASSTKISKADSNEIIYYTDVTSPTYPEGNGTPDSIRYYFDNSSPVTSTKNPDDFPLIRIENNTSKIKIGNVTDFFLSYHDSLGNEIDHVSLNTQTNRNKIRSIKIIVEYESMEPIDTSYKSVIWEKNIRPKNIKNDL